MKKTKITLRRTKPSEKHVANNATYYIPACYDIYANDIKVGSIWGDTDLHGSNTMAGTQSGQVLGTALNERISIRDPQRKLMVKEILLILKQKNWEPTK